MQRVQVFSFTLPHKSKGIEEVFRDFSLNFPNFSSLCVTVSLKNVSWRPKDMDDLDFLFDDEVDTWKRGATVWGLAAWHLMWSYAMV